MFNINKYLEKFSKSVKSNDFYIQKIKEKIKIVTNIDVDLKNIELKDCVVFLKSSPLIKNKIFIYKKEIIENFSKNIDTKIIDIK
ncbi:MAG: hypothetical protein WAX44_01870 [Minisyncoccia bacterium]